MKLLENEEILWESKNKRLLLTTHRLREMYTSIFGSTIKSIMLEELTSSELKTRRQFRFLRQAVLYFLIINGAVYLLNNFLFNSELMKYFFGETQIGSETAKLIFYISIAVSFVFILLFFISVKKVFSFYTVRTNIDFQLRWLDFEERESFISLVEDSKDKRLQQIYGCNGRK